MNRILVIGGNRFFGRRLVHELLRSGDDVTLLNRGNVGDGFGDRVERISCDRRDEKRLGDSVKGRSWDVVYDQVCFEAGEARAAARIFKGLTGKYVFTSSQSVYGPGPALVESAFDAKNHRYSKPVRVDDDYSEAKRQCESVFFENDDLHVIAARFPMVAGPDDFTGRLKFHAEKVRDGIPFHVPNPHAKLSFISSNDAARALLFLRDTDYRGPVNLAAKDPIAIGELVHEIEKIAGKPAQFSKTGEPSPYGIESDWYLDVNLASSLGFEAQSVLQWLGPSVRALLEAAEPTVEGVDFIDRGGLVEFTAHYLLKRGYCCHNGCRNCPYG